MPSDFDRWVRRTFGSFGITTAGSAAAGEDFYPITHALSERTTPDMPEQTFVLNGAQSTASVTITYPDVLDEDHLEELEQYLKIQMESLRKKAARLKAERTPSKAVDYPAPQVNWAPPTTAGPAA